MKYKWKKASMLLLLGAVPTVFSMAASLMTVLCLNWMTYYQRNEDIVMGLLALCNFLWPLLLLRIFWDFWRFVGDAASDRSFSPAMAAALVCAAPAVLSALCLWGPEGLQSWLPVEFCAKMAADMALTLGPGLYTGCPAAVGYLLYILAVGGVFWMGYVNFPAGRLPGAFSVAALPVCFYNALTAVRYSGPLETACRMAWPLLALWLARQIWVHIRAWNTIE